MKFEQPIDVQSLRANERAAFIHVPGVAVASRIGTGLYPLLINALASASRTELGTPVSSANTGDNREPMQRSPMLPDQYLLLSFPDHQLASMETARHGGSPGSYVRCLNSIGRWAVHGTTRSPLLVWRLEDAEGARAAAARASKARGRSVEVLSRGDSSWVEGRQIQQFTVASEPALLGHAAQSSAMARRLRNEADKLESFCQVVRAASTAADQEAFSEVSRAAGKALRAKFGGGSITSAFAWLAGRAGRDALESVLSGDVELAGPLSVQEVAEAVQLAQRAEEIREKG